VVQEHRFRFWDEYVEFILDKNYKRFIYRGHSQGYYRLETSIRRAFETLKIRESWRSGREREMIKSFKSRAHLYLSHLPAAHDDLEWLSVMQHYGAPTRLLDWTYSPFVAAFFAFQQLAQGCAVYEIDLSALDSANATRLSPEWRNGVLDGVKDFIAPFLPEYQNERLILQQGLFLAPGNIHSSVEDIVDTYPDNGKFIVKYVFNLSPYMIQQAINKLKAMNIDDFRLFPGIDGLSRSMYLQLLDPKRLF
jgi:hypothetical protein